MLTQVFEMTNKKEVAQAVMEAYETTYTDSGLVAALREVVSQLKYDQSCWDEPVEHMVLDARDILDIADELEAHYG